MISSMLVAAMLVAAPQAVTPTAAATAGTATARTDAATAVRPTTRICIRNERTGSIMAIKTCRSYARWLADGIDPLQAKRVR